MDMPALSLIPTRSEARQHRRPDAEAFGGRVDEEVAHPHPSQIRMCRFPASGSSWESLARGGADDTIRDLPAKNDSREDVRPRFHSCQFSYPLSFRGQVCETQRSLPCFPSTVLSARHPAFLDRVPVSPVDVTGTIEVLRLPATHIRSLICFASGVHAILLASCFATCAPSRSEGTSGPGPLFNRRPDLPVRSHVDVSGTSQVPRRSILCLCPALRPRPNQRSLASLTVSSMLPPRFPRQELQRLMNFGALLRGFGTCCLRFKTGVATTPARLASGWLARLYREGVEPSGSLQKVSDRSLILPFWIYPGAREVSWPPSLQCGRRDALFRLDIGRSDYLRPLGGIRLDDDSKFLRRIEGHLKTELRDPLAHVSLHGDLHDVRMHLADNGGRRAGWR